MKKILINAAIFILAFSLCRLFVSVVLSKMLHIPDDLCYYETRDAPDWIVRYYMDEGYHVSKDGNLFMLLLEIFASSILTFLINIARYYISRKRKGSNAKFN
ncbi:MAG: hypothetical protein ABI169_18530 [Chitinophagaceae bacterium]